MFKRHAPSDVRFACYTDDANGLDNGIEVFKLPEIDGLSGWWYKLLFFDPDHPTKGTNLYFDLDVVILKDISKFFDIYPKKFCILKDFYERDKLPADQLDNFNGSIFRFESGSHSYIYHNFMKDPKGVIKTHWSDQEFFFKQIVGKHDFRLYPDIWAQSYKWEMGYGDKVHRDTSVAVFHGDPKPDIVSTDWVIENWK